MASVLIKPVSTRTTGGFDATVTSIDPTNSDCLEGSIQTPGKGPINARWDLGGICRDNPGSCNLDMRENENADLRATARRLGSGDR